MQSITLIVIFEIWLQTLVHQNAFYLLHIELIFVSNQLYKRHLIKRVYIINCTTEVP